jgi:phosphoglycolate phosphatase-like HAD superfamily hydrolase
VSSDGLDGSVKGRTLLVLDFDGVICDSIDETFLTSWNAYHELFLKKEPASVPLAFRRTFAVLRPFIRTGEDFVLIQELLATGRTVRDQAEFDEALRAAGPQRLSQWRELFYAARTKLLANERGSWLAMNRIYPHVAAALTALPAGSAPCILSTKKAEFISEILTAHGISVPRERIHYSDGSVPKLTIVEKLRREGSFASAILVEDQIDALRGNANPAVQGLLAQWGYVKPEWLKEMPTDALLDAERFQALVKRVCA